MAAKDKYHNIVCEALVKDGWTITDDPLKFEVDGRNIKIDLGAEKLIGAEKNGEQIAVEVKSFLGASELYELYQALGQFGYYHLALEKHSLPVLFSWQYLMMFIVAFFRSR